jgi:hypothetical protein
MFTNDKILKPKKFIILPYESKKKIIDARAHLKNPKEIDADDIHRFLDYVYEMESVIEDIRDYLPDDVRIQKRLKKLDRIQVPLINEKDLEKK